MPAAAHRAASSVHDVGRYRSNASGQVRPSAINALDTATWQLPTFPSAPQYLPLHARGLRALLGKARIVDREDARSEGHHGAQLRPDACGLPRRMRDEVLQRLVVARITQASVHRLHRLPLAVVEQPVDVLRRGLALRLAAEARAEPVEEQAQSPQQCPCGPRRHARSVQDLRKKYKSLDRAALANREST